MTDDEKREKYPAYFDWLDDFKEKLTDLVTQDPLLNVFDSLFKYYNENDFIIDGEPDTRLEDDLVDEILIRYILRAGCELLLSPHNTIEKDLYDFFSKGMEEKKMGMKEFFDFQMKKLDD